MKTGEQSDLWRQRYEALRQYALDGREILASPPLGLDLFYRYGMAEWVRQWSQATDGCVAKASPPILSRPIVGWQQALTRLLAQMAIPHMGILEAK